MHNTNKWYKQTFPCFLHKLNGIVGKITAFPGAKSVIKQNTKIVTFFDSSHYWGGQLVDAALQGHRIKQELKMYTESRWYSLILLCISTNSYRLVQQVVKSRHCTDHCVQISTRWHLQTTQCYQSNKGTVSHFPRRYRYSPRL